MNKGEGRGKQRASKKKPIPKKKNARVSASVSKEIVGLSIIGTSLIILIGIFSTDSGLFGQLLKHTFVGLLGIGGYILPLLAIVISIFYMRGKKEETYRWMVYGGSLLLMIVCFFHIVYFGDDMTTPLLSFNYMAYSSWQNGGYIGALLGYLFIKLLGLYGTYVLLIVLYGIWMLLVTQFPIFSWLQEKTMKSIEGLQQKHHLNKIEKIRIKEQQPLKEERVIEALPPVVSFDESVQVSEEQPIIPFFDSVDASQEEIIRAERHVATAQKEHLQPPLKEVQHHRMTHEEVVSNAPHIATETTQELPIYHFPPISLLKKVASQHDKEASKKSMNDARKLVETLASFGVDAKVTQIHRGPSVTRYELQPKQGVKVSKIVNLADDIALNLAAPNIRIEAPIPGKAAVGIEVANHRSEIVYLRDVIDSDRFLAFPSKLAFALGKDIAGKPIITDIGKMPHLLIAGATGSGKSVCINTLITSLIYKASPQEVRLIMIDPKVVELSVYNGIPHLLIPVVTDPKKAAGALFWAVNEMTRRYNLFAENNVRDMKGYNDKQLEEKQKLPQIVIIIDELADLMMTGAKEVEDAICRLAQMARAAGIHLVIATQRPSVDVITGVIKANIPSRLAFAVSSGTDSRTILDMTGAEKLLGKGDMLFYPVGESKPIRIQGAFISDQEVESIVTTIKTEQVDYEQSVLESIEKSSVACGNDEDEEAADELLEKAIDFAVDKEKLSISMLQRYFRIGFNRAARLMDALESRGIVGPDEGSKPRKVL